jgi:hypothetical protein
MKKIINGLKFCFMMKRYELATLEKPKYERERQIIPGDMVEAINGCNRVKNILTLHDNTSVLSSSQIYAIVLGRLAKDFYFGDGVPNEFDEPGYKDKVLFKEGTNLVMYLANGLVTNIHTLRRNYTEKRYRLVGEGLDDDKKISGTKKTEHLGTGLENLASSFKKGYFIPTKEDIEILKNNFPSVYYKKPQITKSDINFAGMCESARKRYAA